MVQLLCLRCWQRATIVISRYSKKDCGDNGQKSPNRAPPQNSALRIDSATRVSRLDAWRRIVKDSVALRALLSAALQRPKREIVALQHPAKFRFFHAPFQDN